MDATPRQKLLITKLCMGLCIKEEIEQRSMSRGEAGRLVRELAAEIKRRRILRRRC